MVYLLNFIIAICVWLGAFKIELMSSLFNQPLGIVLSRLTAVDYLLLTVIFIVVTAAMEVFDRMMEQRKRRAAR
jgi:hypothetical protein